MQLQAAMVSWKSVLSLLGGRFGYSKKEIAAELQETAGLNTSFVQTPVSTVTQIHFRYQSLDYVVKKHTVKLPGIKLVHHSVSQNLQYTRSKGNQIFPSQTLSTYKTMLYTGWNLKKSNHLENLDYKIKRLKQSCLPSAIRLKGIYPAKKEKVFCRAP